MTVVRSGSATDVGRVRTVNEDRVLESLTLFAVADGMGGHAGGEVAARTAIESLQAGFARNPTTDGLLEAVREANRAVWERSLRDAQVRGMGTTLTAAALVGGNGQDRLALVNVGDSRAYRFRRGELVQLTTDHSVAEELVTRGELTAAEAAVHPHRHILTRALGVGPEVEVDAWEVLPAQGDRFLLCSDGLTNEVAPERIASVLASTPDPRQAAEVLVRTANEHGGSDNITVVVVDVVVADAPGDEQGPADTEGAGAPAMAALGGEAGAAGGAEPGGNHAPAHGGSAGTAAMRAPVVVADRPPGHDPVPRSAAAGDAPASSTGTAGTADPASASTAPPANLSPAAKQATRRPPRPGRPSHRPQAPRLVSVRSVVFVALLVALGFAVYAGIRWYFENSYFVTVRDGTVVIEQGRIGGFLGFEPHVVHPRGYVAPPATAVLPYHLPALRKGVEEPSLAAARRFVANMLDEAASVPGGPGSQGAPAPTTTVPGMPPATSAGVH